MKLNELSYLMELTALKQKQKQKQKQKPRFLKRNEAFRGNEKKHIFFLSCLSKVVLKFLADVWESGKVWRELGAAI